MSTAVLQTSRVLQEQQTLLDELASFQAEPCALERVYELGKAIALSEQRKVVVEVVEANLGVPRAPVEQLMI